MSKCKHTNTTTGQRYGFVGPVYVHPYTHENRKAHGAVTYTETCQVCAAQRKVNTNGRAHEYSTWARS